jgi:hypothetical protein
MSEWPMRRSCTRTRCLPSDGSAWEGAGVIFVGGAVGVAGATMAATSEGLLGVAVAWLAAQAATGTWAAWRLKMVGARREEPAALSGEQYSS